MNTQIEAYESERPLKQHEDEMMRKLREILKKKSEMWMGPTT